MLSLVERSHHILMFDRTLMGVVQGFPGLVAARWFLGVCESGMRCAADLLSSHHGLSANFELNRLFSSRIVPLDTVL